MNKPPRIGDRIRLLAMLDDPYPIAPGQRGTVTGVASHGEKYDRWFQFDVSWDNGRSLMLVSPPDNFEIIGGDA